MPIATPIAPSAPKVTTSASMTYNKAPRPFGAPSSAKPASIPSPSSAFSPTSASQSTPQPSALSLLAAVNPPPTSTSGVHASYKSATEGQSPALSATKAAVNVPRQPASYNSAFNQYATEAAQDGADVQRRGQMENLGDKPQNGYVDTWHALFVHDTFFFFANLAYWDRLPFYIALQSDFQCS